MIRGDSYDKLIQNILDQCKTWSNDERVGRFYALGKFPFTTEKEYTNTEYEILFDIAISSEIFDKYSDDKPYSLAKIKLTKEGYSCVSKYDWNYSKYLKAQKSKQRDAAFKIGLTTAGIILGLFASTIKGCIERKEEHQQEVPSCCFDTDKVIHDTIYVDSSKIN